jgi:hypothetical protein
MLYARSEPRFGVGRGGGASGGILGILLTVGHMVWGYFKTYRLFIP